MKIDGYTNGLKDKIFKRHKLKQQMKIKLLR